MRIVTAEMYAVQVDDTPAALGLTLRPAWEPHARTWMAWPCRAELWGSHIDAARRAYAEVARTIAAFEPVMMAVRPEHAKEAALALGRGVGTWAVGLDDSWARDIAPHFVAAPGDPWTRPVAGVDWVFNAWGGKYAGHSEDDAFAARVLARAGMRRFRADLVLEGGAICVDGAGTLLATEECLLSANRNPTLTRADIEERLALYLGVRRIIWLDQGLMGDETDGHIDNVACFAGEGRVLLTMPGRDDPSRGRMEENKALLRAARDARSEMLEVIDVPMPALRHGEDGRPLTRSYINFAFAHDALIVPAFDDPADEIARNIIADALPGREIVQLDANPIVMGGGGIHCITYEEPRGQPLPAEETMR